jgi:hypothetical protein
MGVGMGMGIERTGVVFSGVLGVDKSPRRKREEGCGLKTLVGKN